MDSFNKTDVTFPLTGDEFTIPFSFLARKYIMVSLVVDPDALPTIERQLTVNVDYRYVSRTTITTAGLLTNTSGYSAIRIRRVTSATDRLVSFTDGSILRATDLNLSQLQALHIAEEARTQVLTDIQIAASHIDEAAKRATESALFVEQYRESTVRVPLGEKIGLVPAKGDRKGKLAAWGSDGEPIAVTADWSSNTSLALALASKDKPFGSTLVGHDGSTVGEVLRGMTGISMSRATDFGQGYANWPQGKMARLGNKTYMGFNFGAQHGGNTLHAYIIGTSDGVQFDDPILVAAPQGNEEATAWSLTTVGDNLYTIVRFRHPGGDTAQIRHVIYRSTDGARNWESVKELDFKSVDDLPPVLYHHGHMLQDGRIAYGWHDVKGNLGYALLNPTTLEITHHMLRTKANNTTSSGTILQAEPTFFERPDTHEVLIITRAQAGWRTEYPQVWRASPDLSNISEPRNSYIPVDVNPVSAVIEPGGANVLFFYSERYTTAEKRAGLFVMETPLEDAFALEFSRSKHRRLVDLVGDSKAYAAVAGVQHAIRFGNRVLVGVASRSDNNVNRSDVFMVTMSWDDTPLLTDIPSSLSASNTRNMVEQNYWGVGAYAPRIRMGGQSVLSWGPANVELGTYGSGMGERGLALYSYDGTGAKTPAIYVQPYNKNYGGKVGHVDINRDMRLLKENGTLHLGRGFRVRIGGTTTEQGQSVIYHNTVDNTLEIGATAENGLPIKVIAYSPFGVEFRRAGAGGASFNLKLTDSSGVSSTITSGGSVGGISLSTASVNQALHVREAGNTVLKGSLGLANFSVAELSGVTATRGAIAFATNGRGPGQQAGKGSGVPVYYSGAGWLTFYDSTPVQA